MNASVLRPLIVLSLALNVGVLGAAAYHHYGGSDGTAGPSADEADRVRAELGLSAEQAGRFVARQHALEARVMEARRGMRERRQHFFELLGDPVQDAAAADSVLGEMNAIQLGIQRNVADHLRAQLADLSADQQAKYLESLRCEAGEGERRGGAGHIPLLGPREGGRRGIER
jgi:uncharacterized membrane protein